MTLESLYLAAWLDGLRRVNHPPARPVTGPRRWVRLDDTGRTPYVPLRPAGSDRA